MTQGAVYNFEFTATPQVVIDRLLPDVKALSSDLLDDIQLHVSLPGGLSFTPGTLDDFYKIPEFDGTRNLYVVATQRIPETMNSEL
jgi:hypothetical protein